MEILSRADLKSPEVLARIRALVNSGVSVPLAKLYAARGVGSKDEVTYSESDLLPYALLDGCVELARILADAIALGKRIVVFGDYDCDGATASSIAYRGISAFGGNIDVNVPDRIKHGYGLTPGVIDDYLADGNQKPDYILTVDNGISSFQGIERANELGIEVLVTDHHLPAETEPAARVIVNPNKRSCGFPSKALAGCGVMYYTILALADEFKARGFEPFDEDWNPRKLLPIVAVGTIADVVKLDKNNRILVSLGLNMIRNGDCPVGIKALAEVSKRTLAKLTTMDIGFAIGPRINAAGRLESMRLGIECLITESEERAKVIAKELNEINEQRKDVEKEAADAAVAQITESLGNVEDRYTLCAYGPWHEGVIGIVAGRIKERLHRPTFVLAGEDGGHTKGSGRSIEGFHLRDALDVVNTRHPGVLQKFGGHAMAAGVTINPGKVTEFIEAFEEAARFLLADQADVLRQKICVDEGLDADELTVKAVEDLNLEVWGQGFPAPVFRDMFYVRDFRKIGAEQNHSKFKLDKAGYEFDAVMFRHEETKTSDVVQAVYRVDVNEFNGRRSVQLLLEHAMPEGELTREAKMKIPLPQ